MGSIHSIDKEINMDFPETSGLPVIVDSTTSSPIVDPLPWQPPITYQRTTRKSKQNALPTVIHTQIHMLKHNQTKITKNRLN